MRLDVVDLKRFYDSPLGGMAHEMIARRIHALWPDARGLDMAGLGYAAPYLTPYLSSARRIVAAMPGPQGGEAWPEDGRCASALVEETALPFRDNAFDRVIVAHGLEESDALRAMLTEVWRISAGEGRVILIAPSRVSLWSLSDASPFGHGRPFTRIQLSRLLRDCGLEPMAWSRALYAPPRGWGVIARSAPGWEIIGDMLWPGLGGVILVEARKRVAIPPRGSAPAFATAPARA
ncbi:MAG: methyltransferase domain-containing protein [Euryhalocaulis sp.]|uniref:class I SAM-dependent methyltransferase n=1 Tax=Euryhalocaulis sp. TaxID=2744307 RepID=UPI0017B739BC|nr:methyltransferase domain-containing protein [Euryhalocaulis sp.]MBA4800894.1 methyltransferase domain-containing protein [Euryhalocaulis sp.]